MIVESYARIFGGSDLAAVVSACRERVHDVDGGPQYV